MQVTFDGQRYTFCVDVERELRLRGVNSRLEANIVKERSGGIVGVAVLMFAPSVSGGVAEVARENTDVYVKVNEPIAQKIEERGHFDIRYGFGMNRWGRIQTSLKR